MIAGAVVVVIGVTVGVAVVTRVAVIVNTLTF
jgi:hypothetical protein